MAAPISPPTNKPVRELRSKNHTDGFYWELCSRESSVFQQNSPVKRGTKYSDLKGARQDVIDLHPNGLWFCEEIVPLRSSDVGNMPGDRFVVWVWSTDWLAQSSTNAGITYSGDSVVHPIFARDYFIRRDVWEANQTIATLTPLTALIGVTITGGGSDYTWALGTITGGATVAFVCSGGAIIAGIVTKEGSAITSGAAITITGDGTGATATAVIQPASAVLVEQNKQELPEDSNLSKEFVLVRRIWETLPGPRIPVSDKDPLLGRIQIWTQAVIYSGQVSSQSATGDITYQARNGSSIVALKIERIFSDGTGNNADNPPFQPQYFALDDKDDERGSVKGYEVLVPAVFKVTAASVKAGGSGGTNGTHTVTGTTGTGTKFQATVTVSGGTITAVLGIAVAGEYTVPPTNRLDESVTGAGLVGARLTLALDTVQEGSLTESNGIITEIRYDPYEGNPFLLKMRVEKWATVGPVRNNSPYDDERGVVTGTSQLVAGTDNSSSLEVLLDGDGAVRKTEYERVSTVQSRKVVETWPLIGPVKNSATRDNERGAVNRVSQLVIRGAQTPTLTESGGVMTLTNYEEYNEAQSRRVVETWTLPALSLTSTTINEDGTVTLETRVQMLTADISSAHTFGSGTETWITKEAITDLISWKVTKTRAAPGTPIVESKPDEDGVTLTTTRTYVNLSSITTDEDLSGGIWTRTSKDPVNELMGWKVVVTRAIPGVAITDSRPDDDGITINIVRVLESAATVAAIATRETVSGGIWTRISAKAVTGKVCWKITETRAVPGNRKDERSYPYGTSGVRIVSTTLIERAAYTARTANGTAHPVTAAALLFDEQLKNHPESLVVAYLVQIYEAVPTAADQQGLGYFVSFDEGDAAFPHLQWRYKATRVGATFPAFGSACPISGFTSLELTEIPPTQPIADSDFQVIVTLKYEILPGAIVADAPSIDQDGVPLRVTRQRVRNGTVTPGETAGAGEGLGSRIRTTEEAVNDWISVKIVETLNMQVYLLTSHRTSAEVRGRTVDIYRLKGLTGANTVETGSLVIDSEVRALSGQVDERISVKVASLPPTETYAYWDFVPLPLLVFDITHNVLCNDSPSFKLSTIIDKKGGASVLRKHRRTITYHNSYPNPNLSGSTFETASLQYEGKVISFSLSNVLNDALSYTATASDGDCSWTEEYDFDATDPTATAFSAGAWYVRSHRVEPWGTAGARSILDEYYSAAGNPSI